MRRPDVATRIALLFAQGRAADAFALLVDTAAADAGYIVRPIVRDVAHGGPAVAPTPTLKRLNGFPSL